MNKLLVKYCKSEKYFNSLLFFLQDMDDEFELLKYINSIADENLFFAMRITNKIGIFNQYKSVFKEQICKYINNQTLKTETILSVIYGCLLIEFKEPKSIILKKYFSILKNICESSEIYNYIEIICCSLERKDNINLFFELAKMSNEKYIIPDKIFGHCCSEEIETLIKLINKLSEINTDEAIIKLLQISFNCFMENLDNLISIDHERAFSIIIANPNEYSIDFMIYTLFSVVPGKELSDHQLLEIIKNENIVKHKQFKNFFINYVIKNGLPETIVSKIYIFSVYKYNSNKALWKEIIDSLMNCDIDCDNLSIFKNNINTKLKDHRFLNACKEPKLFNSIRFSIHTMNDAATREYYFALLLKSNLYLSALTISTMYDNTDKLEELFDIEADKTIKKQKNIYLKYGNNKIKEMMNIISGLLILKRYDKFEIFMKEVYCPYSQNHSGHIFTLPNIFSAEDSIRFLISLEENNVNNITPTLLSALFETITAPNEQLYKLIRLYLTSKVNSIIKINLCISIICKLKIADIEGNIDIPRNELLKIVDDNSISLGISPNNNKSIEKYTFIYSGSTYDNLNKDMQEEIAEKFGGPKYIRIVCLVDILINILREKITFEEKLQKVHSISSLMGNTSIREKIANLNGTNGKKATKCLINKNYILKMPRYKSQTAALLSESFLKQCFDMHSDIKKIIDDYFFTQMRRLIPFDCFIDYIYNRLNKDNNILSDLFSNIPILAIVKKVDSNSITIFPRSIVKIENSALIFDKQVISNSKFIIPYKNHKIFCKFCYYDPVTRFLKFTDPACTVEECLNYQIELDKINENNSVNDITEEI